MKLNIRHLVSSERRNESCHLVVRFEDTDARSPTKELLRDVARGTEDTDRTDLTLPHGVVESFDVDPVEALFVQSNGDQLRIRKAESVWDD